MPESKLWFHYDLKHPMWRTDYLAHTTDTLAAWGYRGILLEIEDKFRYASSPSFAHPDAMDRETLAAMAGRLRAGGMEIIPLLQTLGHAEYILRHAEFAALRESPGHLDQYDPLSERSREFIIAMLDEIIDIVKPEQFFHLGGDETRNLGQSAAARQVVDRIGIGGLYLQHMRPIFEHVQRRGLRPIIWPDIVLAHPEIIDEIPRSVVLMDWDYWTGGDRWPELRVWGGSGYDWDSYQAADLPAFRKHLERFAVDDQTHRDGTFRGFYCMDALRDKNFEVILAPAARSYGDSLALPRYDIHLPNCFYAARKGRHDGLGCCVTSWAVRHAHPTLCLVGAFAAAWSLQSIGEYSARTLADTYTRERYGVAMPDFERLCHITDQSVPWSESRNLNSANLAEDRAAIRAWLGEVDATDGGRAMERRRIEERREESKEGLAIVDRLAAQSRHNTADFGFWHEGLEYQIFCADFVLALLSDDLLAQRQTLLPRIQALRQLTTNLFSTTYPAYSAVAEATRRYGMHERILQAARPEVEQPSPEGSQNLIVPRHTLCLVPYPNA